MILKRIIEKITTSRTSENQASTSSGRALASSSSNSLSDNYDDHPGQNSAHNARTNSVCSSNTIMPNNELMQNLSVGKPDLGRDRMLSNENSGDNVLSKISSVASSIHSTNLSARINSDDENEHFFCKTSTYSSYSSNLCKLDSDLDGDLHLHHDHNTKFLYKNTNHKNSLFNRLNEMRKSNIMCDVTLVVDQHEISCHKTILVANSSYFQAMFSNGLLETNSNKIELKEIDSNSLDLLIDYMYTGEVLITETNVQSLLASSNLLDLPSVKYSCGQFIQSQLDITNCIGIREFADFHSCNILQKHADAFIEEYFSEVVQKDEFLNLNCDQVINLISRDHLAVDSERIVYDSVIKWINHDFEKRNVCLSKLMEHIRFGLLSQQDLVSISEDSMIKQNIQCMEYVLEAFQYKMITSNNLSSSIKSIRCKPREALGQPKLMFIFGGQAPKAIPKIDVYDFKSQEWTEHDEMEMKRCRAGCAYNDGLIYLIGGFNGQTRIRSCDIYNPLTREWSKGPNMLCRRATLGVGVLDNKIYAVGGFDGMTGLASVECWSMNEDEDWQLVAPLSTRRSSVGIAVINNYLYAIGGYCGVSRECLDSVERYDPVTDTWTTMASMTNRRSGACVNINDGKIYVVGGHDGPVILKSMEVYDPICNKWDLIGDLNIARRNAGFVIHNGLFYIIGGDDGHKNLSSVEIYNPQRDVWSLLPSFLNQAKSYTSCLIIDNCEKNVNFNLSR